VTPEAVANALQGFQPPLVAGRDMDWLALAVRRSLAMTMSRAPDTPERQSNADTRKELERLGKRAGKLWAALFDGRSYEADGAIFDYAMRHGGSEGWVEEGAGHGGFVWAEPGLRREYREAVASLDWLSGFLQRVAREIPSQAPRWTQTEWRAIRVHRGYVLAGVYEAAFGATVTVNMGQSVGASPSPFMEFYQRMVALAFNEQATADLSGVLQEAANRHRSQRYLYVQGLIPGLPSIGG
jgi:hypothetical protein